MNLTCTRMTLPAPANNILEFEAIIKVLTDLFKMLSEMVKFLVALFDFLPPAA